MQRAGRVHADERQVDLVLGGGAELLLRLLRLFLQALEGQLVLGALDETTDEWSPSPSSDEKIKYGIERLKRTAQAANELGVRVVAGFSGSNVWENWYSWPPGNEKKYEEAWETFAERFNDILNTFATYGVRFAMEVHPTEIAYDFVTTKRTLAAIGRRPGFGINLDPSHFAHQFLDAAAFALEFADRIYHVHVKDSRRLLDGRSSILGGHLNFGELRRGWDFVSPGHGDVDFEALFRALNRIGYAGPAGAAPSPTPTRRP